MILPLFPLFYFLAVGKLLDKELAMAIIIVLSFFSKLFFSLLILETHISLINPNYVELLAARKANNSRRAFLKYVFHEVRVPLNSICMGLQLLQESETIVDEDRETVEMMKEATHFMSETLNDVLSIQKIEEGKLDLHFEPFNVSDVLNTVKLSLRNQITAKGVVLECTISASVPNGLNGDRFRVEHVLANLLSNAIKFSMEKSTIRICVSAEDIDSVTSADSIPLVHDKKFSTRC